MGPINFTAIDFETACHNRASICQIGLVRVEGGKTVKELDILVQPPENYYHPIFPDIHGIQPHMTEDAEPFYKVWHWIAPYIENQTLVAHNMAFDNSCLRAAMMDALIDPVSYSTECTYKIFGKALNVLCEEFEIALDHHNALSDALACAGLYLIHLTTIAPETLSN